MSNLTIKIVPKTKYISQIKKKVDLEDKRNSDVNIVTPLECFIIFTKVRVLR
jgi:hypothetical protein